VGNICDGCKFADWKRTKNGRLHPGKQGRCTFEWVPPPLPAAFYYFHGIKGSFPKPNGGWIERGANYDACETYQPKETTDAQP
jgi:hypothetical protein